MDKGQHFLFLRDEPRRGECYVGRFGLLGPKEPRPQAGAVDLGGSGLK
ncbi:hypothetical protein SapgrDRAFT_2613 [Saprospira grandis DSM 2844]|uniref:Uncharacterized protein n=1 Tax=Saprospira grandis DSM 2844 TaxID=694433 RepID=J0P397_9BACT|nr:hypothetical protein SapgrDRAFT_2613 [Saprospira grandis DSM 2844]